MQEQKAVLEQIGKKLGEQPAAAGDQATPQVPSAFRTTHRSHRVFYMALTEDTPAGVPQLTDITRVIIIMTE